MPVEVEVEEWEEEEEEALTNGVEDLAANRSGENALAAQHVNDDGGNVHVGPEANKRQS